MLSRKVANDDDAVLRLIGAGDELAGEVRRAVDISSRSTALLLALLVSHRWQVVYIPAVRSTAWRAFRGEGKTDTKDAGSSRTRPVCAGLTCRSRLRLTDASVSGCRVSGGSACERARRY